MNPYRCFLAHSRQDEEEDINHWQEQIREKLAELKPDREVSVTPGRDCYQLRGKMLSWVGWIRDVACGKLTDGTPRYHAIIVPGLVIGKATYEICQQALVERKPVIFWNGVIFIRVVSLITVDPKDYQTGWRCELAA
jgi:hypothetical protein